jgi:uncharacterized protein (DUF58 family)
MLLVDMSASGRFGTSNKSKIDTAAEIAAILAFNAIKNNDKVGIILFTDTVEKYIPPKKGSSHIFRVIKEIFTFKAENTGTDIGNAIDFLGRVSTKKTVTFVISDFISENFLKKLKIASKRHEMITVLLSDPRDFELPSAGIFTLTDFETGKKMVVDASDSKTRARYREKKTGAYNRITEDFKKADIDCLKMQTSDSVPDALTAYFRYRETKLRRRKG